MTKIGINAESIPEVSCPACGARSQILPGGLFYAETARGANHPLYRCRACSSYVNADTSIFQLEVDHHARMDAIPLGSFKGRMFGAVIHLCGRFRPPPAMLLDVGCSYGAFLEIAHRAGYVGYGCDILPAAVAHVRRLGIAACITTSLHEFNLAPPGSFDVLTCMDTNYYWSNQPAELRAASRLLKPGGIIVIRTSSKSWMISLGRLISKVTPAVGRRILKRSFNDHRFSMPAKSLVRLLEDTGFKVLKVDIMAALHSDGTALSVKANFILGWLIHAVLRNVYTVPGIVIVAARI
jgi:2-polyprenyl-3-methyl-5-hydroxy-6-metoxy-1,4-benzoquinol methylase